MSNIRNLAVWQLFCESVNSLMTSEDFILFAYFNLVEYCSCFAQDLIIIVF